MDVCRAKFTVQKKAQMAWGKPGAAEITLSPTYDTSIPEDKLFSEASPSGELHMYVDNPAAVQFFELGKAYYLDFTPAPVPVGSGG